MGDCCATPLTQAKTMMDIMEITRAIQKTNWFSSWNALKDSLNMLRETTPTVMSIWRPKMEYTFLMKLFLALASSELLSKL